MASLPVRFRSLIMFEVQSYRYYRKHLLSSPWSPMHLVAVVGLTVHFLALAAAQLVQEAAHGVRSLSQPRKAVVAETPSE